MWWCSHFVKKTNNDNKIKQHSDRVKVNRFELFFVNLDVT